jgi:hypothetical protein
MAWQKFSQVSALYYTLYYIHSFKSVHFTTYFETVHFTTYFENFGRNTLKFLAEILEEFQDFWQEFSNFWRIWAEICEMSVP